MTEKKFLIDKNLFQHAVHIILEKFGVETVSSQQKRRARSVKELDMHSL